MLGSFWQRSTNSNGGTAYPCSFSGDQILTLETRSSRHGFGTAKAFPIGEALPDHRERN